MAEDQGQGAGADTKTAPLPEWLKKAQVLAQHEENAVQGIEASSISAPIVKDASIIGEPIAVSRTSSASDSPAAELLDTTVPLLHVENKQNQTEPSNAEKIGLLTTTPLVSQEPERIVLQTPEEILQAPVPSWLQKAADKAKTASDETVMVDAGASGVADSSGAFDSTAPMKLSAMSPFKTEETEETLKTSDSVFIKNGDREAIPGTMGESPETKNANTEITPGVMMKSSATEKGAETLEISQPADVLHSQPQSFESELSVSQPRSLESQIETASLQPQPPSASSQLEPQSSQSQAEASLSQSLKSQPELQVFAETPKQPSSKPTLPLVQSAPEFLNTAKDVIVDSFKTLKSTIQQSQTAGVPETGAPQEQQNLSLLSQKPFVLPSADIQKIVPSTIPDQKTKKTAKSTLEERRQLLEAEKIYQSGLATIRDLIAPSSMEIRYDAIRIEGMYAQSFYVYAYPRYLDTNWLSPIVNFDVTMDIAQFIYPIDSATIMKVLKKKVAQMQASVRMAAEKGIVSDPALETALQDADELRTQIQRGQEKLFQFALYFTIYSEDDKKLEKISRQLQSILGSKLILTKKTDLQAEHGFSSCLPLCLDELEIVRNMNTSPLSSTFPFSSSDLTSNQGILYGLNRHNDSLIIFDRFSLENANSVVFAKSGAGKSYAVKLEILRSMMIETDVIVIDPENEYEALAQTVGGSYLRVSLTSDRRINPFDLPAPIEGEEIQPGDLLRSNIISLHGLLKIMLGGVTPEEEGILDKALIDVYALKGITMELVDPSSIPAPTMEDLYDILATMEGGQSLAQRLQKYTTGTYSGVFNKPTNIDLNSGLMVFCIRDLEDSLRPTAMYIILNFIWNRIRSKLKKRLLIIDEAWTMMQYEDSAKFLFGLVKRARKYYLGITTITQDVEDFVKSPYGKPVVTNSSLQLLLKQAPAAIDILGKIFNLTEGEKYMLLNSGVGQGLFFAGLKHVAIQIIASYTEDKIVTTNPEEILRGREKIESFETA